MPLPFSTSIVADLNAAIARHVARLDRQRRSKNNYLFRETVRRLRSVGNNSETLAKLLLNTSHSSHEPGRDPRVNNLYRRACRCISEAGGTALPSSIASIEDILYAESWRRVRRAAPHIVEGSRDDDHRMLLLTITVRSDEGDWSKRYAACKRRRDEVLKRCRRHVLWSASSFEVQSAASGYNPHWHVMIIVHKDDVDKVTLLVRPKATVDVDLRRLDECAKGVPRTSYGRRTSRIRTLLYVVKAVGGERARRTRHRDKESRLLFPGPWQRALHAVAGEDGVATRSPVETIAARALVRELNGPRERLFSCGRTIRKRKERRPAPVIKTIATRGRPRKLISRDRIVRVMNLFGTAKATSKALQVDPGTLRRLCDHFGLPRTGRSVSSGARRR